MFVTELAGNCGMHTWTTNSQTVLASSTDPLGFYEREQVPFTIVDIRRAPKS